MEILDGKKMKQEILDELKEEVNHLDVKPNFVVIQIGDDEASNVYIKQKAKMAEYIGYGYAHIKLPYETTEELLLNKIQELNSDDNINGILVQMPLPKHIDVDKVQNMITYTKDIDGLSDINSGRLFHGKDALFSCTPYGVMELLQRYNIDPAGMNAVVVGRSILVGKPMAAMLTNANATVTLCHSKTKNLSDITRKAELLIVTVCKSKLITEDMVSNNAIVIDVGISRIDNELCGDVDFDKVSKKVKYITPVPGGVGPMTVAMLGKNILTAYKIQKEG